ncbi:MAG: 4-hydroxy-tetrahydrodipicolinate reductase [Rhodospirillales bacterium]|nr:4-hydroxy-tetrahydrodipicolinate reductase [Rhodospirillales bacterium]
MADLKIGVMGAGGRMGGAVLRQVMETDGCVAIAACDMPGSPAIGRDAGELAGIGATGVIIGDDAASMFAQVDAVIEFTLPDATIEHARIAADTGRVHVIGTTGLDAAGEAILREAGAGATIVHAPNMSKPVNILFALTRQVAALLDDRFDIEILEMHHKHKVDAPSGTALGLGRAAAAGRGVDLAEVSQMTREGHTGPRKQGDIGFVTLRGGDVTGDHSVIFAIEGERLELTHKASSRQIFARGAVDAALWARDRPAGFYTMFDVLGLPSD